MNKSENTDNKSITESKDNEDENKEMSCLSKLGVFVLVVGIISAIIAWIVYKIRAWKALFGTIRQAEEGTFVGDNPALVIMLCVIAGIISTGFVIYLIVKDK